MEKVRAIFNIGLSIELPGNSWKLSCGWFSIVVFLIFPVWFSHGIFLYQKANIFLENSWMFASHACMVLTSKAIKSASLSPLCLGDWNLDLLFPHTPAVYCRDSRVPGMSCHWSRILLGPFSASIAAATNRLSISPAGENIVQLCSEKCMLNVLMLPPKQTKT